MNNSVADDYSRILPIYKSSEPGTERVAVSEMEYAVIKGSKLINLHSITKKPKRRKNRSLGYKQLAGKDEFNKWVDDSYLMMGEAFFYQKKYIQALENFSIVTRKFSEEKTRFDAYVWMVRCYTELERYQDALELINDLDASSKFPKRLDGIFSLAVADYHMRLKAWTEAIPQLKLASESPFKKHERARYKYILAQLYKETGQNQLAANTFREVARMNPSYIMAFNARINATGVFSDDADTGELKKELRKMLRDEKNKEFRDQIYYALANIWLKEGQQETAIENYIQSAAVSSRNHHQRALSCITLAEIYFNNQNYKGAQSYYDSAMIVIDENYPNYLMIADRYKNLTRLTDNLYTVVREDSLQRLALMDDTERNRLVTQWIQEVRAEELRRKQAEVEEMRDRSFFRINQSRLGLSQQQQGSGWYFYNPTTVTYGKTEFEQLWGRRRLEDNWRRKNKGSVSELVMAEETEEPVNGETPAQPVVPRVDDRHNREYYLQDLPLTEEKMAASHIKIRDALFNAGRIFRQDFHNYPMAISEYEDLLKRYEHNIYQLTIWFELWELYKQTGDQEKSAYYRNLIIGNYPDSKYARYLVNPNFFIELEARNDSLNQLYQQTFNQYRQGHYPEAGRLAKQLKSMEPDSLLLPKVSFIETIADGTQLEMDQFGKKLEEYIHTYPASPAKPLAENILKLILDSTLVDYQQLIALGYLSDEIENDELLTADRAANDEFGGKFSYDDELLHYFVIAFPVTADVDLNRLKFDIANYNIDHYMKTDFDIETENMNPQTHLLVVRSMEDKQQALIYFRSIIRKREVFETLKNTEYVNFTVSSANFRTVMSDRTYMEYLRFFIKNYSRFIGGDFPQDELPEPEELMAKALEEETRQQEKGTFVVVKPETGTAAFSRNREAAQNFVIAVNDAAFSTRRLVAAFNSFNRTNFADLNLSATERSFGNYRLLVIKSPGNISQAMPYFRQVITTRSLFDELETRSYRNFIISDENLEKLIANGKIEDYMNFFREYYISGAFNEDKPAERPVVRPTVEAPATPGKSEPQAAFNTDLSGEHDFLLLVPSEGIDRENLKEAISLFNLQNYASPGLSIQEVRLDEKQIIFRISQFDNKDTAMAYLRAIVRNAGVYGPLAEVNYRNFIISAENYRILLDTKDINGYMQLYRNYYLAP